MTGEAVAAPPVAAAVQAPRRRLVALDGLRGAAAAVVLLHHCLLVQPALAQPYLDPVPHGPRDLAWWLTYSPLHLAWDGTEAVFVFFVLSGYVLVLPFLRPRAERPRWLAYYPQRLLRLYLPVWGAVALSLLWIGLVVRDPVQGSSWWLARLHPPTASWDQVRQDAGLVMGTPGWFNTALWSLKWEVVFSLTLPAFVVLARVGRGWWALKGALLLGAVVVGAYRGIAPLYFLPMFGLGSLLAAEGYRAADWAGRRRLSRRAGWLLVAAALLLLNSFWTVYALAHHLPTPALAGAVGRGLEVAGAALLVLLVARFDGLAVLGRGAWRWLGRRSFSLYLVHEPIVVTVAFLVARGRPAPLVLLAAAVPTALLVAEGFYRVVERPSHTLARRVGAALSR